MRANVQKMLMRFKPIDSRPDLPYINVMLRPITLNLPRPAICLLSLCMVFTPLFAISQNEPAHQTWTFLPDRLIFPPLTANYHEPRVGLRLELGSTRMKLDIGSCIDLIAYSPSDDGKQLFRMGMEFFTYALTTSVHNLRLQVDAVDGFFGGHVTFRSDHTTSSLAVRLRLIHLSSHLIDGHYDLHTDSWIDGKIPIPLSRDSGELTVALSGSGSVVSWMIYSGVDYATFVRPDEMRRWSSLHGFELYAPRLLGPVFGKPPNLYVADHLSFFGLPEYIGTNNLEGGIKFGEWTGTGLKLYVSYYRGTDMFSQYYTVRREQVGVGFAVDFW